VHADRHPVGTLARDAVDEADVELDQGIRIIASRRELRAG